MYWLNWIEGCYISVGNCSYNTDSKVNWVQIPDLPFLTYQIWVSLALINPGNAGGWWTIVVGIINPFTEGPISDCIIVRSNEDHHDLTKYEIRTINLHVEHQNPLEHNVNLVEVDYFEKKQNLCIIWEIRTFDERDHNYQYGGDIY